jgi:MmyB-like transcription regulator ligand binding domain
MHAKPSGATNLFPASTTSHREVQLDDDADYQTAYQSAHTVAVNGGRGWPIASLRSGRHTGGLSMAWKKVAKDTVALLSAEASRNAYNQRLSELIGELSTRSDEFVSGGPHPSSRSTAPAFSSSTTQSQRPRPVVETFPLAGRFQPDAPHLHRRAWVALAVRPRVSWPAGSRPPTASDRPPRLIPRRRLNRSGGLTDMGKNLKRPVLVFWAAGEAGLHGRSHLRHQYLGRWLHKLSVTAYADSAMRDGNVR